MKQKMATSGVLSTLPELTAEVYLFENPLAMLRHQRLVYNVKCSAIVGAAKREYMGLYLDDCGPMVERAKTYKRVINELQEQRVILADEENLSNECNPTRATDGPTFDELLKTNAAFYAEQTVSKKSKKKRDMSKVKCYNCQDMVHC
ncbi:hypothetical protein PHPALM_9704 [Phytophthora palmivora]|uniref:Uncharacterized protein n=1 Tax=Phytophthora palmivora TaxID=4796 RepID=A0A2P4Y6Z0_9STRA|nr:hypothetical protein PHPALM_9704 [Phytophthora palmivora]